MPKIQTIQEYVDNRGNHPQVDEEHGVLRGVKLLGLSSSNGREYPKETVARAMTLYEGAKVNVNHPDGADPGQPRDYRDRIGVIRGPHLREAEAGLFGDFHFNPKHVLAEQLVWDAKHAPENVGFSHNVQGKVAKRNGRQVVEEIVRVQSVDLVADPATTRGLFETGGQEQGEEEEYMPDLTLESLQSDHADLVEAIRAEAIAEQSDSTEIEKLKAENAKQAAEMQSLKEEVESLDKEKEAMTEKIDRFEAAEQHAKDVAAVDDLIKEAKLPEALVTDVFRTSLLKADEEGRKALIEDRQAMVKLQTGSTPKSKEQRMTEDKSGITDSKGFVALIT
jgi:hypothetical protein